MAPEQIDLLESLVDELMKDQPEEAILKSGMLKVGIEYTEDPVERINRILLKMHESNKSLGFAEKNKKQEE